MKNPNLFSADFHLFLISFIIILSAPQTKLYGLGLNTKIYFPYPHLISRSTADWSVSPLKEKTVVDSGQRKKNSKNKFPKSPTKEINHLVYSSKHRIKRIIIDPGHGGKDPGAHGKRFKEKNITLAIALELKKQFEDQYPDIKVILSREEDKFIELDDRAIMAKKKKADLFISIHCNANGNTKAKGPETYAIGLNSTPENLKIAERENSVILLESGYKERYEGFNPHSPESYIIFSLLQQYNINQSLKLAGKIEQSISNKPSDSRGVKQAGFLVLRKNTVPSILLEVGFITNSEEEKKLGSTSGQHKIAKEILKGFENYRKSIED